MVQPWCAGAGVQAAGISTFDGFRSGGYLVVYIYAGDEAATLIFVIDLAYSAVFEEAFRTRWVHSDSRGGSH